MRGLPHDAAPLAWGKVQEALPAGIDQEAACLQNGLDVRE